MSLSNFVRARNFAKRRQSSKEVWMATRLQLGEADSQRCERSPSDLQGIGQLAAELRPK
jgi:hypothetical protein